MYERLHCLDDFEQSNNAAMLVPYLLTTYLTGLALTVRPQVSTVWLGITLFFAVRFSTSAGRIFSGRGGFGQWWS